MGSLALAFACAGCERAPVVPGVTYSREIGVSDEITRLRVSPDSSALVFGIDRNWWRNALGILAWPDGGMPHYENTDFELYRYDLARRTGPDRVARWKRVRAAEDNAVLFFDGRTATVTTLLENGARRYWAVDVKTGRRHEMPADEGARLLAERIRLDQAQADEQSAYRAFFEENAGQFYQWDTTRWEQDLLFELPLDEPSPWWRERQLRKRAKFAVEHGMHYLRSARARSGPDSLRLSFETFVPVPRPRPRVYRVELELFVHDPPPTREHRRHTLELARPLLPRRGGRFTMTVPWSRIDSTIASGRAGPGRPSLSGHLYLLPVRVPEDSLLSGYPQGVHMGQELRFVTASGRERHDLR